MAEEAEMDAHCLREESYPASEFLTTVALSVDPSHAALCAVVFMWVGAYCALRGD